jgi:hypothetical protein
LLLAHGFQHIFSLLDTDRYDLVECLIDYRAAVTIHGDDVLAHSNWEIGENFLRKYGYEMSLLCVSVISSQRYYQVFD